MIKNIPNCAWDKFYEVLNNETYTQEINLEQNENSPIQVEISASKFKEIVANINKYIDRKINLYDEEAIKKDCKNMEVTIPSANADEISTNLKKILQSNWVDQKKLKNFSQK